MAFSSVSARDRALHLIFVGPLDLSLLSARSLSRSLLLPYHSCLQSGQMGPQSGRARRWDKKATGYSAVYEVVPHLYFFVIRTWYMNFVENLCDTSQPCLYTCFPAFLVDGKINFEIEGFPVLGISGASNPKQVHPSMTYGRERAMRG